MLRNWLNYSDCVDWLMSDQVHVKYKLNLIQSYINMLWHCRRSFISARIWLRLLWHQQGNFQYGYTYSNLRYRGNYIILLLCADLSCYTIVGKRLRLDNDLQISIHWQYSSAWYFTSMCTSWTVKCCSPENSRHNAISQATPCLGDMTQARTFTIRTQCVYRTCFCLPTLVTGSGSPDRCNCDVFKKSSRLSKLSRYMLL